MKILKWFNVQILRFKACLVGEAFLPKHQRMELETERLSVKVRRDMRDKLSREACEQVLASPTFFRETMGVLIKSLHDYKYYIEPNSLNGRPGRYSFSMNSKTHNRRVIVEFFEMPNKTVEFRISRSIPKSPGVAFSDYMDIFDLNCILAKSMKEADRKPLDKFQQSIQSEMSEIGREDYIFQVYKMTDGIRKRNRIKNAAVQ